MVSAGVRHTRSGFHVTKQANPQPSDICMDVSERTLVIADVKSLAVGDPNRQLCGFDMGEGESLDYRKRDGRCGFIQRRFLRLLAHCLMVVV